MQAMNFTDKRDGKTYKTVKIGGQVWMAENLAFDAEGSLCYDDKSNGEKYGRLYDWNTAMKACPDGWHLPSNEEWAKLVEFAGGEEKAGGKLKANSSNGADDFGFAAMLCGLGSPDGYFGKGSLICNVGSFGSWWTATEYDALNAYHWYIYSSDTYARSDSGGDKFLFYSVRCVKD